MLNILKSIKNEKVTKYILVRHHFNHSIVNRGFPYDDIEYNIMLGGQGTKMGCLQII